jgi:hypothetical protein
MPLTVPELMLGYKICRTLDEDVFGCFTSPPKAAEWGWDCEHAYLVKEGIEAILPCS